MIPASRNTSSRVGASDTRCGIPPWSGEAMKRWFRMFQSIQWKLVVIYLSLILIAMQLTGVYLFRSLEKYYFNDFNKTLENQIRVLTTPSDLSELLSKGVDNQK